MKGTRCWRRPHRCMLRWVTKPPPPTSRPSASRPTPHPRAGRRVYPETSQRWVEGPAFEAPHATEPGSNAAPVPGTPRRRRPRRDAMLEALRQDVLGEGACIRTPFGVRRVTYADHVASGRALRSVETALRDAVLPLYANCHTEYSATGAHTTRVMHDASEYVKRCLGAGPDHKIVFRGTGATGAVKRLQEILGVAVPADQRARLLDVLPTHERLVVFVGPYEHHSNEVSWRESLAEVVTVPMADHGQMYLAALERSIAISC